jgi:hypothetical protein
MNRPYSLERVVLPESDRAQQAPRVVGSTVADDGGQRSIPPPVMPFPADRARQLPDSEAASRQRIANKRSRPDRRLRQSGL